MQATTSESFNLNQETLPLNNLFYGMPLREIERRVILETLKKQRFNRTSTARVLGIGVRTLQRKLKLYREMEVSGNISFFAPIP